MGETDRSKSSDIATLKFDEVANQSGSKKSAAKITVRVKGPIGPELAAEDGIDSTTAKHHETSCRIRRLVKSLNGSDFTRVNCGV